MTFTELGDKKKSRFGVWKADVKFSVVSEEQERDYSEDTMWDQQYIDKLLLLLLLFCHPYL